MAAKQKKKNILIKKNFLEKITFRFYFKTLIIQNVIDVFISFL